MAYRARHENARYIYLYSVWANKVKSFQVVIVQPELRRNPASRNKLPPSISEKKKPIITDGFWPGHRVLYAGPGILGTLRQCPFMAK